MKLILSALTLALAAAAAPAAMLPGFRIERLATLDGFPTSLAVDSHGRIYYTTTVGSIYRLDGTTSIEVATVPTDGTGNSGLLGMALLDDDTAVVHYTTPMQTWDIISTIDLRDGSETILTELACDIDMPGRPSPSEHHGGNPSVAPDGSIFVGIGDYSWSLTAADRRWNSGKIFRIDRQGKATQFARGLRNPFDMVWEPRSGRLIVADNGPTAGDEIHIIEEDTDCGWPHTWGTLPPVAGAAVPDYVFEETTAPTGMLLLNDQLRYLRRGFLLGGFVSRAIYYFEDVEPPLRAPYVLIERDTMPVIDIAQSADGTVYFAVGGFSPGSSAIYRLDPPLRGDCNGDGVVDAADREALAAELADGARQQDGVRRSSWGCDVDEDGLVTPADAVALGRMLSRRRVAGR